MIGGDKIDRAITKGGPQRVTILFFTNRRRAFQFRSAVTHILGIKAR